MKLTKNQINFIINSDVEVMVSYLMEEKGMDMIAAFAKVYNSTIYNKLVDTNTGLYLQSPGYIYSYLMESE